MASPTDPALTASAASAERTTLEPLAAGPRVTPLHILLTNDDGFDSDGIARMRDALLAAGHSVTVVAPLAQQSGRGTALDTDRIFQEIAITEFRPGDFSVDGTPVTTTLAALDFLLEKAPDLVVSGINEGQNVGEVALSSGTVSAAVTAILRDVPAIAVSAGRDFAGGTEAELLATYDQAASLVAALVADLSARPAQGLPILPERTGLNVNVPAAWNGSDLAFTAVTGRDGLSFVFVPVSDSDNVLYTIDFAAPSGGPDSEGQRFAAGFATVSAIDADLSASEATRAALEERLTDLSFENPSAAERALEILVVNDDGFDAPGLGELVDALRAAGHAVKVVAPRDPQSGRGTDLDAAAIFTEIEVMEFAPGDFSVASTPVNVASIGLNVLAEETPDLVISGINEGANVGPTAVSSGTVSAAVRALLEGVPSIAVSAGLDLSEAETGFPSTELAYEVGALFTVDLVADLLASAGDGPILPEGVALSVNVPTGDIAGISFTLLDAVTPLGISFGPVSASAAGLTVVPGTPNGDPLSEGSEFLLGNITLTPLDGDYTAPEPLRGEVEALVGDGAFLARLLAGADAPDAGDFLGFAELPSGLDFEGTTVGGLSGLVRDPQTGTYWAVSDDRADARIYELAIDLADGTLDPGDVEVLDVTLLTLPEDGLAVTGAGDEPTVFGTVDELFPDLEGISIGPDGTLYLASERNAEGRFPQIFTATGAGLLTGELPVDGKFLGTDDATGVRNNLGFESLTVSPDGTTLWTATESALLQDGATSTTDVGAAARIIRYELATGTPVAEYVYEVEPIAAAPEPADAFADSGLVELLAIDDNGTLLALERSFSIGAEDRGYTGKLFLVRTQGATNVIGEAAVETAVEDGALEVNVDELASKELLLDLSEVGIAIDNIEALALGPTLADGRQTLIIQSDDNFSAFGPQASQFLAFALDLEGIPTLAPLVETPDELRYPGPEPIVIAHRGASGEFPEHTLGAYAAAIAAGADFIEPDLVATADGVLIARHEPWLATVETDGDGNIIFDEDGHPVVDFKSTDVAEVAKSNPDFMARLTTKDIGFNSTGIFGPVTGWFAEDFTLAEIKTLRAVEDEPELRPQSALFDGQFEIPTLAEVIALVQGHEAATGEKIGIYPETKEPSYFDAIGLSLEERLIETLVETGFTDPDRVFIQSFEIANLLDLQENIMPAAGLDLPLIQLLFNGPDFPTFDLLQEAQLGGNFAEYAALGFDATTTSGDLYTDAGLALIAGTYAEGIGPNLSLVAGPGFAETGLVDRAQDAGLLVHAYTHRVEADYIGADGSPLPVAEAIEAIYATGIDGLFTDNPADVVPVVDAVYTVEGSDPDDPAIWVSRQDPDTAAVITAMKNGGLRVYDLDGAELQRIEPEGIRYNNVDILYEVSFAGSTLDLAVASDRANDTLAIFIVGEDGRLIEATSADVPETIFGVDDGEATAYGLATYRGTDGTPYAFVTQADGDRIAQLEIIAAGDGFSFEIVRQLQLPNPEGLDAEDLQSEGIAIDRETATGYVAVEEALGLLSFAAEPDGGDAFTTVAGLDAFEPDLEGVSIYYGPDGSGLILVSSQGDATFTVLDRQSQEVLESFAITGADSIDGVEESDGLEIYSGSLPGYAEGLLVTQDGSNSAESVFADPEDGEIQNFNVNFKYSDLGAVLELFGQAPNPDFTPFPTPGATEDDDVLFGDDGANEIDGLGGDDEIFGLGGNDDLVGGPGDDLIVGGPGDDAMDGNARGQNTGDRNIFDLGDATLAGNDVIAGFDVDAGGERSFDTLVFEFKGEQVTLSDTGSILTFVAEIEKDGDGATDALLEGDDLVFVFARDGADGPPTASLRLTDVIGPDLPFDALVDAFADVVTLA